MPESDIEPETSTSEGSTSHGTSSTSGPASSDTATIDASTSSDEASAGSSGSSSDSASDSSGTDTDAPACVVDGMLGEGEQCDDGNEDPGDGCTECAVEEGWGCFDEPSSCFTACDPLLQDCADGDACYPADPIFVCAPDGSARSGQQYADCTTVNGCNPGLVCIEADTVMACDNPGGGCCTTICDLQQPVCPDMLDCFAFYDPGMAPEGLDHVGACAESSSS